VVHTGGNLLDPRENSLVSYVWGLGKEKNNVMEAYALLKGLYLARERNIINLLVFEDLMMVIQAIIKKRSPGSNTFNSNYLSHSISYQWFQLYQDLSCQKDLNSLAD
jgi:ribonuclease HI